MLPSGNAALPRGRTAHVEEAGGIPARDATGEADFGNIDAFEWDNLDYALEGDWGEIEVRAAGVEVALAEA